MPKKYLKFVQLYARTPFSQSHIHYMVKVKPNHGPVHSQIQFLDRPMTSTTQEYLDVSYQERDVLAVFVVAISKNNRVVNLGHVTLEMRDQVREKKQYLKGIVEQNGFVIYSSQNHPFPAQVPQIQAAINTQAHPLQTSQQNIPKKDKNKPESNILQQSPMQSSQVTPYRIIEQPTPPYKKVESQIIQRSIQNQEEPNLSIRSEQRHLDSDFCQITPKAKGKQSPFGNLEARSAQAEVSQDKKSNILDNSQFSESFTNKITTILSSHKAKNVEYRQHLQQLELEFQQQRQKLLKLGVQI